MSARLLVTEAGRTRELLFVGTLVAGRDSSCDISGADPLLSRRHAEFTLQQGRATVRDLASRNGILVNGTVVQDGEVVLASGDRVQVAGLDIVYEAGDGAPLAAPPPSVPADDATQAFTSPFAAKAAAKAAAPPPVEDDRTYVIPPPSSKPRAATPPPPVAAPSAPAVAAPAAPAPPPPPPPVAAPAPARPAPRAASPVPAPTAPAPEAPAPRAKAGARRREAEASRAPASAIRPAGPDAWAGRVRLVTVGAMLLVFALTAGLLAWWQSQSLAGTARSRALAISGWMAADVASRLQQAPTMPELQSAAAREPGVLDVMVTSVEGRVLFPADKIDQTLTTLPGDRRAVGQVFTPETSPTVDGIAVVRPVTGTNGQRVAVLRMGYRPPDEGGRSALMLALAPAALAAVVLGLVVAGFLRRFTAEGVQRLNEQIEQAIAEQIDTVHDTVGLRETHDLVDSVNYLIIKVRTAPDGRSRTAPAAPAPAVAPVDGVPWTLEANDRLVVTRVAASLLAAYSLKESQVVGRHMLESLPNELADGVMGGLAALDASGEGTREVPGGGPGGQPVSVTVARDSARQVLVTISAAGAPQART